MRYCPFCGAGLSDEMGFCPKCGKKHVGATEHTGVQTSVSTGISKGKKKMSRKTIVAYVILALCVAMTVLVCFGASYYKKDKTPEEQQTTSVIGTVDDGFNAGEIADNTEVTSAQNTPVGIPTIANNQTYGTANYNLDLAYNITENDDYYFYEDGESIYRVDKTTKGYRYVAAGSDLNLYKGYLYYIKENDIYRCNLDGSGITMLIEVPDEPVAGVTWRYKQSLYNLLVAENCIFVTNSTYPQDHSLYIYDLNLLTEIGHMDGILNYTYWKDLLYVSTDDYRLIEINMKTLEFQTFITSQQAHIEGVDSKGSIFYTDSYGSAYDGVYKFDIYRATDELVDATVLGTQSNIGRTVFLCDDTLYLCDLAFSKNGKIESTHNYKLIDGCDLVEWGTQELDLSVYGYLPSMNYIYLNYGTTVDLSSGEIIGTWVFEHPKK